MMIGDSTGKVIMACDLRNCLDCYNEGTLGNYSTAFQLGGTIEREDPFVLVGAVHEQIQKMMNRHANLYLLRQCYTNLDPAVLDAAFISYCRDYPNKAGKIIGSIFSVLRRRKDTVSRTSEASKEAASHRLFSFRRPLRPSGKFRGS